MSRRKVAFLVALFVIVIIVSRGAFLVTPASAEVVDVVWELKSFEAVDGKVVEVATDEKYTIQFEASLRVIGQCDCNDYSADYAIRDRNSLSITKLTNTEAACRPTSKCWEFLDALKAASAYEIQEGKLRIYYNERKAVLNLSAQGGS